MNGEIVLTEVLGPADLALREASGSGEVGEVAMVGEYNKRLAAPKLRTPLAKTLDACEKLLVMDFVVALSGRILLRVIGTRPKDTFFVILL